MKYTAWILGFLPLFAWGLGGDHGGGPGGFVESAYRYRANKIISKVRAIPEANSLCAADVLSGGLIATVVKVVDKLEDTITHLPVPESEDAWTNEGVTQLKRSTWRKLPDLKNGRSLNRKFDGLILHELLRGTRGACPDERFVLRDQIFPILLGEVPRREIILPGPLVNVSVNGASNWVVTNNQTRRSSLHHKSKPLEITGLSIYGGLAGECDHYDSGTCNSCASAANRDCDNGKGEKLGPLCACNPSRISDSTQLTIFVASLAPRPPKVHLVVRHGGADLAGSTPGDGQVFTTWGAICGAISGGLGTCNGGSMAGTLELWVDNNVGNAYEGIFTTAGAPMPDSRLAVQFTTMVTPFAESVYDPELSAEGVGQFTPMPGDGRIYLTNMAMPATFPSLPAEDSTVTSIRVFVSKDNLDRATPASADNQGSANVIGSDIVNQWVTGLDKSIYYVRLAVSDQANNILQFYPSIKDSPAACRPPSLLSKDCPFAVDLR